METQTLHDKYLQFILLYQCRKSWHSSVKRLL